jgi:hypothetical protein
MPTPVKGSLPKFLDVVDEQAKVFFLKVRENEHVL